MSLHNADFLNINNSLVNTLLPEVKTILQNFATTADFASQMGLAFGEDNDYSTLQQTWLTGEIVFPNIEVCPITELNGAYGGFVAAKNTIYLSQELFARQNQDLLLAVLLEEYGHFIDTEVNSKDSPGDEGAIFSALVRGEVLTDRQVQILKVENDTAILTLDDAVEQLEMSTNNSEQWRIERTGVELLPGQTLTFNSINFSCGKSYGFIPAANVISPNGSFIVYYDAFCFPYAPPEDKYYSNFNIDIKPYFSGISVDVNLTYKDDLGDFYTDSWFLEGYINLIPQENGLFTKKVSKREWEVQSGTGEYPGGDIDHSTEYTKPNLKLDLFIDENQVSDDLYSILKELWLPSENSSSLMRSDYGSYSGLPIVFDSQEECFDTSPFIIKVVNGKFEDIDKDGDCDAQGTIVIGRKDGIEQILKVENAKAELSQSSLKITNGTAISLIGNVSEPLFKGNFEIPFNTGKSLSFKEASSLPNDFKLGGLNTNFNSLSIQPNSIALEGDFTLPNDAFLWSLSSTEGKVELKGQDALFIGKNGIGFGSETGKVPFPSASFTLFTLGFLGLSDAKANIQYEHTNELLKIQGDFKLVDISSFAKLLELPIDKPKLTLNLSDENFIQIKDGITDFNGKFSVNDFEIGKFKLSKMGIDIETEKGKIQTVTGTADLRFPFSNTAFIPDIEAGFFWEPNLALDKINVTAQSLNIPIYGLLYLQDVKGELKNLAPYNSKAISQLFGFGLSLGLQKENLQPLLKINLEGEFNEDDTYFAGAVEIVGPEIVGPKESILKLTLKGNGTWDFTKGTTEAGGSLTLNSPIVSLDGSARYKSQDIEGNYTINGNSSAKFADNPLLFGFKGQEIASATYNRLYTNDLNSSNDYHLVYGKLSIPLPFFNDNDSLYAGYQWFDDGKVKRIFNGKELPLIGSWNVNADTQWLMMTADWDNSTTNKIQLRVKTAAGNFIEEKDFTANNIAVVDALSGSKAKTVIVNNPTVGIWDLEVVNTTGLGEIRYTGFRDSIAPTIEITEPSIDVNEGEVSISYNAFDADSDAQISLFYDTDNQNHDGFLITDKLIESEGLGEFIWNTQGVAKSSYYVYAMIQDENNAPVFSYSKGQVKITEEADVSFVKTSIIDSADIGDNLTYAVTIQNNGTAESKDIKLTETLPEGASFISATVDPVEKTGNKVIFNLGNLKNGATTTVDITLSKPNNLDSNTVNSFVDSKTYDPNLTNNSDALNLTVTGENEEKTGPNVYRFYNTNLGVHFYTASEEEKDFVLDQLPQYRFEGASYVAAATPDSETDPLTGAKSVYRFYNQNTGVHLYTISEEEKNLIIKNLGGIYRFEDTAYYAYDTQVDDTIPVYRFYNTLLDVHFYTPSAAEKDFVLENLPQYRQEGIGGIGFYVNEITESAQVDI